jgi:hypothetical protein
MNRQTYARNAMMNHTRTLTTCASSRAEQSGAERSRAERSGAEQSTSKLCVCECVCVPGSVLVADMCAAPQHSGGLAIKVIILASVRAWKNA